MFGNFSSLSIKGYIEHKTLSTPTPQNGQTQSNKLSAVTDELFECVWPFCGVGAWRIKMKFSKL